MPSVTADNRRMQLLVRLAMRDVETSNMRMRSCVKNTHISVSTMPGWREITVTPSAFAVLASTADCMNKSKQSVSDLAGKLYSCLIAQATLQRALISRPSNLQILSILIQVRAPMIELMSYCWLGGS